MTRGIEGSNIKYQFNPNYFVIDPEFLKKMGPIKAHRITRLKSIHTCKVSLNNEFQSCYGLNVV